jgi:hypothetical protein
MDRHTVRAEPTLDTLMAADAWARACVEDAVAAGDVGN